MDSLERMLASASRRLRTAERMRALPSGVAGPRDLAPLAREARMRFSVFILSQSHDIWRVQAYFT